MPIYKVRTKKGVSWRARVMTKSGRRLSKCFHRKVDAEQWEAGVKSGGLEAGRSLKERIRFPDMAELFLKYGKPEFQFSTYQKYESAIRNYLIPFFRDCWADSITKKDVMDFKVATSELGRSSSTQYFIFTSLKTIMKKALELDYLEIDPTSGVRPPKKGGARTDFWSPDEVRRFLTGMKGHPRFPLYMIALNTGMRSGEIFGLQWDCVDFENRLIEVRRTFDQKSKTLKETTKTHSFRSVGMSEALFGLLKKLKNESASDYVVERRKMGCGNTCHLARVMKTDCERVGVRPIVFHSLRHTFATQFVSQTGDIHAISNVMGHKSVTMTERYAHFSPQSAAKVASKVSFDADQSDNVIMLRSAK